jgi:hypothetical protein
MLHELPAVQAHAIDVRAGARLEVDARVAERRRAVALVEATTAGPI